MELASTSGGMVVESKSYVALFRVIYLNKDLEQYLKFSEQYANSLQVEYFDSKEGVLRALEDNYPADIILAHTESGGLELLDTIRNNAGFGNIPFVLMVNNLSHEAIEVARKHHADDIFSVRFDDGDLITRIRYFKKRQWYVASKARKKSARKIPAHLYGNAPLTLLPRAAL